MMDATATGEAPLGAEGGDAAICDVAVSVINFRTPDMTIRCVESALAARGSLDLRVAVVDNRSGDGSLERIEAWRSAEPARAARVRLVASATNSGFSGGHNRGVAALKARAYLILNSDALVRPGAIETLTAALAKDPGLGFVAPRLEDEDGTPQISCFRFPSPASELARGAQIGAVTRALARSVVALPPPPDPAAIDWMSFACVLARAEVLEALGPMDEGYFMYFEDADYCWRARRAGWRLAHVPEARVVHLRGGSAPVKALHAARKRLPAYYYASRTRFFRKTRGPLGPLAANLGWTAGRALSALKPLFGLGAARIEKEGRDVWTNFLNPLGDRRSPDGPGA